MVNGDLDSLNNDTEILVVGSPESHDFENLGGNKVRAYHLQNGDIFTFCNKLTLMYEDEMFHEVEFGGYEYYIDGIGINPIWNKIKSYTGEEINAIISTLEMEEQ